MMSKKTKKSRRLTRTEFGLLFVVIFFSIFYMVWRQSLVRAITTKIYEVKAERQELTNKNVELELDIVSLSSEERIVDYAIKNLGMKFPDEDETAFIVVTEMDDDRAIGKSDTRSYEDTGEDNLQLHGKKDEF